MKNETVRAGVKVRMKLCPKCREVKPAGDFFRGKRNVTTGLSSYCKRCTYENAKKWRANNRDRVVDCKRNWREKNKARDASYKRRHRRKYPDRARARNLLSQAIHAKKITPQPCRSCGATENIEGHHHDYGKPYDVIWLCSDCHKAVHRNLDLIKKQSAKKKRSLPAPAFSEKSAIHAEAGA